MFVLIANPTDQNANVKVTYLLDSGAPIVKTYPVAANSRFNIYVNGEPGLANAAVASRYESDVPIIVERTMWWPGAPSQWTEGHNSFGVTSTGTKWALAEGEVGRSAEHRHLHPGREHVVVRGRGQGDAAVRGRAGDLADHLAAPNSRRP